ncbi:MAG: polysaccharide biosynthesis/export family protein [candidate division KSB1 bacterium]|nr:polysaccharide biosynthesis/export family protein [candidate division KSB1 bacterium]
MNKVMLALACLAVIISFSCAPHTSATQTSVVYNPALEADSTQQVFRPGAQYRLGFGDKLDVKFFNNQEYNESVAVRPDGRISLPRIGDIRVVGMSVSKLDTIITNTYAEILISPDVTVIVREFGGQDCYVLGHVKNPGVYPLNKGLSVIRAIAAAGGPKQSAKMNSVLLIRATEDHNMLAERLDLDMSNLGSAMQHDRMLRPYDVIFVPPTFISDLGGYLNQIYDIVLRPLDIWVRWQWYSGQISD